ncbi:DUF5676 family membrane protein [Chamaesiphon minutus]|uniref:Uncharacterized protein n=1 Tax=Chamaesiphon minutus (strain ATCC 27169 / PCC 6605) TaxID=1173020 RepID=K9UQ45_CHAP6|nr:DUF5676 family membrane protein [Chamaesiphon minutus]AFY96930.1 hypothetical protein Cha6605_6094 [Chamaesiphon minutus PCC 6605]
MTHSNYHSEESRVRSYSVMRLSVRSLVLTTIFVYILCVLFIAFAPRVATILFGYTLHADLINIVRSVGWDSLITGLCVWSVGNGLYAVFMAQIYNRLVS